MEVGGTGMGGWHGHGWVGDGKWIVKKGNVSSTGRCLSCSEQLACVDTNEVETQKFVDSLVALAMERKAKMNSCESDVVFSEFQDWLEKQGDYEAILDGANIGLYQQNFVDGSFSLSQLESVVKELYRESGNNKWPLILLHKRRVRAILEEIYGHSLFLYSSSLLAMSRLNYLVYFMYKNINKFSFFFNFFLF
ncbi:Protein-only RNase P C-terminal [Arabidopsis suecica]|uniref:Protein-only RNase P C-terminal n=1 Tax=Arabidopsis suecica TaxID=45249 RepID=A0A8T2G169_ARASU|nr:Protein-only RNase P C-terminal [Arabidopsis suecica]KAG7640443.1 Protein-only RNase P C-terminal [Arabidopsis suecica]